MYAWWGKPDGKRPLGRLMRRRKDNTKMYPQEIGWVGVDSSDLAQDRKKWRAGCCEHGNEHLASIK